MRNDQQHEDLFDETRLRRALRLDAAELPPRVDVAAIAARAELTRPAFVAASIVSTLLAGLAGAALVSLVLMALPAVAPTVAFDLFAAAIQTLAHVAIPASALLALAAQPTVPIAALAALAVAIAHEYAQRRERVREVTS
ncbi:MAG: hypothetical protein M3T56_03020 [Chloroflexota bacterium]|nr:hypothetical protein [Chloroflexota bacterium]